MVSCHMGERKREQERAREKEGITESVERKSPQGLLLLKCCFIYQGQHLDHNTINLPIKVALMSPFPLSSILLLSLSPLSLSLSPPLSVQYPESGHGYPGDLPL